MESAFSAVKRPHVVIVDANTNGVDTLLLAKQRGYEVTFVRSKALAGYSVAQTLDSAAALMDRQICLANSADIDELYGAMSQLHDDHPIDAFVCPWEFPLAATAEVASRLGVRFTNAQAIARSQLKNIARQILQEREIPSARFATAATPSEAIDAAMAIGFPLVVKPATGMGSKQVSVFYDLTSLASHVEGHWQRVDAEPPEMKRLMDGPLLLEEKLTGHMVSVEIAANAGLFQVLTITDRQRGRDNEILELGSMMPAALEVAVRDVVEQYALHVTKALGLDRGVFHLEIMLTPDGPRLVEANPRVMGGSARALIRASFDIEILETVLDLHVDDKPPPTFGKALAYSASHIIGGIRMQRLERNFSSASLQRFAERIFAFSFSPKAGDIVPEYRNNFDAVGTFVVSGQSPKEALALRDDILILIERETGLALVR